MVLREDEDRVVVARVHGEVAQLPQRRVALRIAVELGQIRGDRRARGLFGLPVARLVLVLLVVDVLFRPGPRDVLDQLVARVDAPGRRGRRGDRRPHLVGRHAAVLQVGRQDVVGVDEEVRTEPGARLVRDLLQVLLELPFGVAPGEVGVRLLEPDLRQGLHHGGLGERLGEEDDLGVVGADVFEQPLPEVHGLGVRVVDAEDRDAAIDPEAHDPQDLAADALVVVVEVQGIDVLVLLRRVLGVGDRAVGQRREPLRVLGDPRVVGRALQREVEGELETGVLGRADEPLEVGERAELGVDGVVAAVLRPDRVGRARVVRAGLERVVRTLAEGAADRVHRRDVDDVEAHARDRGQASGGGAEGAALPRAVVALAGALRLRGKNSYQLPTAARVRSTRTCFLALWVMRLASGRAKRAAPRRESVAILRRAAGLSPGLARALAPSRRRALSGSRFAAR